MRKNFILKQRIGWKKIYLLVFLLFQFSLFSYSVNAFGFTNPNLPKLSSTVTTTTTTSGTGSVNGSYWTTNTNQNDLTGEKHGDTSLFFDNIQVFSKYPYSINIVDTTVGEALQGAAGYFVNDAGAITYISDGWGNAIRATNGPVVVENYNINVTNGNVTASYVYGDNLCYSDGTNCVASPGGSMNYTNIAMTNQSNVFTRTSNFTAPVVIKSNTSSGYSARIDLFDYYFENVWVALSASRQSDAQPYMGTISQHPFFFVTNNSYSWGASDLGGLSIGKTFYNKRTPTNNLIVQGNVSIGQADAQAPLTIVSNSTALGRASMQRWNYDINGTAYNLRLDQNTISGNVRPSFSMRNNNVEYVDFLLFEKGNVTAQYNLISNFSNIIYNLIIGGNITSGTKYLMNNNNLSTSGLNHTIVNGDLWIQNVRAGTDYANIYMASGTGSVSQQTIYMDTRDRLRSSYIRRFFDLSSDGAGLIKDGMEIKINGTDVWIANKTKQYFITEYENIFQSRENTFYGGGATPICTNGNYCNVTLVSGAFGDRRNAISYGANYQNGSNGVGYIHLITAKNLTYLYTLTARGDSVGIMTQTPKSTLDVNGNVTISGTFPLNLTGDATVYDDVVATIETAQLGLNSPTFSESVQAYGFANEVLASEDYVFVTIQIPHAYKEGSNIGCHLHIMPDSAEKNNVTFQMNYTWYNIGGAMGTYTSVTKSQNFTSGVAYNNTILDFGQISGTGKTMSSTFKASIKRKSSDASDTYTGTVFVDFFDCHIERDKLGSNNEYTN